MAQAFAIKLYLDEQTKYTMSDVMKHFRTTQESFSLVRCAPVTGYCVHTSHAAVFLWRGTGIPARVSVGYAHQLNSKRDRRFWFSQMMHTRGKICTLKNWVWVILDVAPQTVLDEMGDGPDMRS